MDVADILGMIGPDVDMGELIKAHPPAPIRYCKTCGEFHDKFMECSSDALIEMALLKLERAMVALAYFIPSMTPAGWNSYSWKCNNRTS